MVWFQCEDCGDNLKKPKLPGHFRVCSAFKLSCIDCGEVFGQHNVDSHNQCITEAEKYGPKGQGKALNGSNTKPKIETKPKPEVDINVGLSERPPWFCSLCNTKATSKQTLLLHADGKKHRGKARAFHAANQTPKDASDTQSSIKDNNGNEVTQTKDLAQSNGQNSTKDAPTHEESGMENNGSKPNNKRKHETSENGLMDQNQSDISTELQNGDVAKDSETEAVKQLKKAKTSAGKNDGTLDKDSGKKKIKWKKLITSALKSNAKHKLKLKKLGKIVMESLQESGKTDQDKSQVMEILEQKIHSTSKFIVDGKYIRLADDN